MDAGSRSPGPAGPAVPATLDQALSRTTYSGLRVGIL